MVQLDWLHFFQLIWSGKFKNLRNISIHNLFDRLGNYPNIISSSDLLIIKNAYYYFRWTEDILHIKFNSKINTLSFNNSDLLIFDESIDIKLSNHSQNVIGIYNKLFNQVYLLFVQLIQFQFCPVLHW